MPGPDDPLRPRFHFTAPAGWINDPLGVTWRPAERRYELFYQFNPEAPVWTPACRWGQASSPDLVRWTEPRTALEPSPDETGCWSGAVVVDGDVPVIVYTSVLAEALGQGRVALAHGDAQWSRWTPDAAGPVLPAPAPELGLAHVRDPFVWWAGEEWRMLLGAGGTDGRPSVLQFSSADLRSWRPDGVLVAGDEAGPGGTVWECPQLFPLDGAWVLIVSVWEDDPRGVACAVGDYDGARFVPRAWQPLAELPIYATTAFSDADGRRCALSWLQDSSPADGNWAGALSVPWLLALDGDRVVVRPHPDVDALRTGVPVELGPVALSAEPLVVGPLPLQADVEVAVEGDVVLTLDEGGRRLLEVAVTDETRLLVDAGVVEIFSGGTVAAARPRPAGAELSLGVAAQGPGGRLRRLVARGMERVVG